MSLAVAGAVKEIVACVEAGRFDDVVYQDVFDRLERAGDHTFCTTLQKLASRYVRSKGGFLGGGGGAQRKGLSTNQGVVLMTFVYRFAEAAGAGRSTTSSGAASETIASKRRKALEAWQTFTWASLKRCPKQKLLDVLVKFAPLLLGEDERFAESVLAERFHDAGLDLSFLEETRGNAALTQVLTRYAELQPPTFCSLLNKYLHSRQPAAQVSSLVLLQRILGSSERLLSRLKVSGLLTSLVSAVRGSSDPDIVALGLWILVLILPHTASDTVDNLPVLLDLLHRSMKMVVRASQAVQAAADVPLAARKDAPHARGASTAAESPQRGVGSPSMSPKALRRPSGPPHLATASSVSSLGDAPSGAKSGTSTAAGRSGKAATDAAAGSASEVHAASQRSVADASPRSSVSAGSGGRATTTFAPSSRGDAQHDQKPAAGSAAWEHMKRASAGAVSVDTRAPPPALPLHVAQHTLAVMGSALATLFRCLYALFPCVVLDWTRAHCEAEAHLLPLVSSLVSNVRLMPHLLLGDNRHELDGARWKNRGVAEVVTEMQSAEAYIAADAPLFRRDSVEREQRRERHHRGRSLPGRMALADGDASGMAGDEASAAASDGSDDDVDDDVGSPPVAGSGDARDSAAPSTPVQGGGNAATSPRGDDGDRRARSSPPPPPLHTAPFAVSPPPPEVPAPPVATAANLSPTPSPPPPPPVPELEPSAVGGHLVVSEGHTQAMAAAGSIAVPVVPAAAITEALHPDPERDSSLDLVAAKMATTALPTGGDKHLGKNSSWSATTGTGTASGGAGAGAGAGDEAGQGGDAGVTVDAGSAHHSTRRSGRGHGRRHSAPVGLTLPADYRHEVSRQKLWLRTISDATRKARLAVSRSMRPTASTLATLQQQRGHQLIGGSSILRSLTHKHGGGGSGKGMGGGVGMGSGGPSPEPRQLEQLLGRVVVSQQELIFERHVARQLARRCRRLQREAVVVREATHTKAVLAHQLMEASKHRSHLAKKYADLRQELLRTKRLYDNAVIDGNANQQALQAELDKQTAACRLLKEQLTVAREEVQAAGAHAAAVTTKLMQTDAHRREAEYKASQVVPLEEEVARVSEQLRQWEAVYHTHIRPKLAHRHHEQAMALLGTATTSSVATPRRDVHAGSRDLDSTIGSFGGDSHDRAPPFGSADFSAATSVSLRHPPHLQVSPTDAHGVGVGVGVGGAGAGAVSDAIPFRTARREQDAESASTSSLLPPHSPPMDSVPSRDGPHGTAGPSTGADTAPSGVATSNASGVRASSSDDGGEVHVPGGWPVFVAKTAPRDGVASSSGGGDGEGAATGAATSPAHRHDDARAGAGASAGAGAGAGTGAGAGARAATRATSVDVVELARLRGAVEQLQAQTLAQADEIAALEARNQASNEKWAKRMSLVEHKYSSLKAMHVALQRRTMELIAEAEATAQQAKVVPGPDPMAHAHEHHARSRRGTHHSHRPQRGPSSPTQPWQLRRTLSASPESVSSRHQETTREERGVYGSPGACVSAGALSAYPSTGGSGRRLHVTRSAGGMLQGEGHSGRSRHRHHGSGGGSGGEGLLTEGDLAQMSYFQPRHRSHASFSQKKAGTATPPAPVMHSPHALTRSASGDDRHGVPAHRRFHPQGSTDSDGSDVDGVHVFHINNQAAHRDGAPRHGSGSGGPSGGSGGSGSGSGNGGGGGAGGEGKRGLMGRLGRMWSGWVAGDQRGQRPARGSEVEGNKRSRLTRQATG